MPDIWSLHLLASEIVFKRVPGAEGEPASSLGVFDDIDPGWIVFAVFAAIGFMRWLFDPFSEDRGVGVSVESEFRDGGGDGGGGD